MPRRWKHTSWGGNISFISLYVSLNFIPFVCLFIVRTTTVCVCVGGGAIAICDVSEEFSETLHGRVHLWKQKAAQVVNFPPFMEPNFRYCVHRTCHWTLFSHKSMKAQSVCRSQDSLTWWMNFLAFAKSKFHYRVFRIRSLNSVVTQTLCLTHW
jgi:hypothetical protein